MNRTLVATSLVALCCIAFAFNWYQKSLKAATNILTVGTMSGWPPYVSINEQGQYEGFDVDIAQELAKRLNKKLVFKDMDTAYLITALEQGSVDFIITGLDITYDRLKKIAMVPYQGEEITTLPLLFWKEIPAGITSLEDLKKIPGALICVEPGSSQERFLEGYSSFEIKRVDPLSSILEIKYGKALATLLEPNLYQSLKKKYPELQAITIPLDEKNKILGCGIGIKKDNTSLINKITSLIADFKREGFLARKEKQWFTEEKS